MFTRVGAWRKLRWDRLAVTGLFGVLTTVMVQAQLADAAPQHEFAPRLRAEDRAFVAEDGARVILRGVNLGADAKLPPFRPQLSDQDFGRLKALGFNVVRLPFIWEAFEPAAGHFDESYLDAYAQLATMAARHEQFVIVDFHQDAYSRYLAGGCGDGFPKWTLPPEVTPATPDNGPGCASWAVNMVFDAGVRAAWQGFFANTNGIRDHYLAMVGRVARRMATQATVIGYDLLNEPMGDEAQELLPLYQQAAAAIRAHHAAAIMFISPHAATSLGVPTTMTKPNIANVAFSPHYYDAGVNAGGAWAGLPPRLVLEQFAATAAAWGAPLFLAEFGAPAGTWYGREYIQSVYDELDRLLASGTQWAYTPGWREATKDGWNGEDFSIVGSHGELRDNSQVRPYPTHIAGRAVEFKVSTQGCPAVRLVWDQDTFLGLTMIKLPADSPFHAAADETDVTTTNSHCSVTGDVAWCLGARAGRKAVELRFKHQDCANRPSETAPS